MMLIYNIISLMHFLRKKKYIYFVRVYFYRKCINEIILYINAKDASMQHLEPLRISRKSKKIFKQASV